jgi:hypothetical protein
MSQSCRLPLLVLFRVESLNSQEARINPNLLAIISTTRWIASEAIDSSNFKFSGSILVVSQIS